MSFLQGRTTFLRFKVSSQSEPFGQSELDLLAANAIGSQRIASADGVETGWIAGGDILDTAFTMEKNVIDDALLFAMRIDSNKLPTDLLKAYYQADLRALTEGNPSGKPSARQKREAKESARDRLEHEARDGRFLKRKAIECLWDRTTGELLFGAASMSQVDRLAVLFKDTFGAELELIPSGLRAYEVSKDRHMEIATAKPSQFIQRLPYEDVSWIMADNCVDFLGNEFLLWLWYTTSEVINLITLSDGTEAELMFTGALSLDCPRSETGSDTFCHENPTILPEANRAIQSGKLPRKAGMTIVRNDEQFTLTIHAETLGIGSAKLPTCEEETEQARRFERIGHIRSLIKTLDLLYEAFCRVRFSGEWINELAAMQRWLSPQLMEAAA